MNRGVSELRANLERPRANSPFTGWDGQRVAPFTGKTRVTSILGAWTWLYPPILPI
jgi:hypothetical protein